MRSVQLRRLGVVSVLLTAVLLAGPACAPARAAGPSFSCDKATAPVDRAICADPALSAQDLALERAFRAALASDPAGHDEMLKAQRAWAKGRAESCHLSGTGDATGEQAACLAGLTRERIATLQPRDPRDVILAGRIADEIRRKDGYTDRAGSLVEALMKDPDSPVRFSEGDRMSAALAATLPDSSDDLIREGDVYRLSDEPATLAVAAMAGTAHCWSYRIFRQAGAGQAGAGQAGAGYAILPDPDPGATEGTHCGDDIGFGRTAAAPGDSDRPLPLFADATFGLDRPTMLLLALRGTRWRRVGAFSLDYETALAVAARSCSPKAGCGALEADALALARARDAAGSAAPQRLGAAVLTTTLAGDEADVLTDFGRNSFDGWSTLERDAPAYKLATAAGVFVMRVSHGTIGWRVNEDYDVAVYRNEDGLWQPDAGFQIRKKRVRLRSVTVE